MCAPKSVEQADLEGNHSYKFIYSGFFTDVLNGRKLLISLVGAGRFERPTPCAQGRCATRLRYAPTAFILHHFRTTLLRALGELRCCRGAFRLTAHEAP